MEISFTFATILAYAPIRLFVYCLWFGFEFEVVTASSLSGSNLQIQSTLSLSSSIHLSIQPSIYLPISLALYLIPFPILYSQYMIHKYNYLFTILYYIILYYIILYYIYSPIQVLCHSSKSHRIGRQGIRERATPRLALYSHYKPQNYIKTS